MGIFFPEFVSGRSIELFPGSDILKIVEVRFRMQPDAGMDGLHALGQLHDDDHIAGLDFFRAILPLSAFRV